MSALSKPSFEGYISPAVEDAIKNDQGGTYVLDFMKGNGGFEYMVEDILRNALRRFPGYDTSKKQVLTNEAGALKWVDQT